MTNTKQLNISVKKLLKNNLKIKKNEKILVLTDRKRDKIFDAIVNASCEISKNVFIARISGNRSNSAPLPKFKRLFSSVNVIIASTTKSISHSPETRLARKRFGVRVVSMPNITEELFIKAASVNIKQQKKINDKLYNALHGKKINITNKAGTKLMIKISRCKFDNSYGDCSRQGALENIPAGEVSTAPISAVNGTLKIDVWEHAIRPKDIIVEIRNGKIVSFSKEARPFVKFLKKNGECALHVVELGIGTNPKHKKPIGNILHDEKILGSAHIAFGGWGNLRKCPIHEDVIILKPTIQVDGRVIMKNGVPKW